MKLYRNESSDPKRNAQHNLVGLTHYVDDDTLRFHKSRILSARHTDNGLLFAIVCSDAVNFEGSKRVFRYTIFDVFGNVLERPTLENGAKSSKIATAAMWKVLNAIDAKAVTLQAIANAERHYATEIAELRAKVKAL